ncbi:ruvB-like protein 1 [Quercus lobata]|uniref:ruvB-like protein 1 n=1 Tax=Quercus lobata TaxID=97700 RepID=UPI001246F2EF|nr:ruvB-like protein 1 [Quercus lobata]
MLFKSLYSYAYFVRKGNFQLSKCFCGVQGKPSSAPPVVLGQVLLGTHMNCPYGILVDLLDRLIIIRTQTYDVADMIKILALRANVEDLVIDDESLAYLGDMGLQASLRHAVQLLSPSSIMAKMNGRDNICKADIEEVKALYMDAKSSARLLQAQQEKYIS